MPNPTGIGGPQPGEVRNPEGKNGHLKGWMRYGDRLQQWLEKSGKEIKELFADPDAVEQLSSIDIACAQHVKDIIAGEAEIRHRARESGIDRIEGKPKQTFAHGGDPDNSSPIKMDGTFTLAFGTDGNDSDKPESPAKT